MNKSQLLNAALARKIDTLTSYIMADLHMSPLLIKAIHTVDICLYWLIALSCRKGSVEEWFETLVCLCACQAICIIFLVV